ncbi:universal stress protein [Marinomonas mediterranea]|jgi:Universal stress protein UspA and related nucleotide-binding proteins|uniref:UspA domain-containing protein n=1 Tax=Marinomonas mediterranea (strain ATCC 700492 / JCM 21426 / NBRC 103028 / MMB-1) TaxID=717774 RepID=F2JVS2_MARM1|nr:universal stress protein [Marinomonas mediterranea]ADZ91708.1 UspA domain-containing protein [Marinomonas mediterranea MMB-1]WCN17804.1 universal stress protein [Marinomonas mediterranea MMB-1]
MIKVFAGIDESETTKDVIKASAWASARLEAPLTLLHTIERPDSSVKSDLSGAIGFSSREHLLSELTELDERRAKLASESGKVLLQEAKSKAELVTSSPIETIQRHGDIVDSLIELENTIRLVVLGKCDKIRKNKKHAIGSHVETSARRLHSPILVTPDNFSAPTNFMIAYDGREAADNAINKIIKSPLLKGLKCHLVMVATKANEDKRDKIETAKSLLASEGYEVEAQLLNGEIYPILTQYKRDNNIELLVMGAYAHSKVRQFFVGSNTNKMISESKIPLLILR